MDCGEGVPLCGVLTLETGRGGGTYRHSEPVVHGLWPQVPRFGNSECLAPLDSVAPHKVYRCYDQAGESHSRDLGFERHEWAAHGRCAGAASAEDFFEQVCDLADAPLRVMAGARAADMDLVDTVDALQRAGFCVWNHGSNQQVELSTCAGHDGRWRLADSADFERVCGPAASAAPASPRVCIPNHRGPRCKSNRDCLGLSGCARCARSGYCTDIPMHSWRRRPTLLDKLGNATDEWNRSEGGARAEALADAAPAAPAAFALLAASAMLSSACFALGLLAARSRRFWGRSAPSSLGTPWLAASGGPAAEAAPVPAFRVV